MKHADTKSRRTTSVIGGSIQKGNADFIALLDGQRTLMDYRLSYQRVLADNRQKLAELEMLAGTELDKQQ